ncbi:MAG: segregation/condensation protein A [Nanoarchaeota archaeon]
MQDQIYEMLINKDEITWQSLIYDLIKSEQLNPWDIDISILSNHYIETLKKLKEANFFISGKVLLAAALLLKIKSEKFINEDFVNFDNLLYPQSLNELELYEDTPNPYLNYDKPELIIRTPLARKRKVTITDLMGALQKALEVNKRKVLRRLREEEVTVHIPEKKVDISALIKNVYNKIIDFFKYKKESLTFSKLIPSEKKEDKILTFIPLLHLDSQEKINLSQEESFGEIYIEIKK